MRSGGAVAPGPAALIFPAAACRHPWPRGAQRLWSIGLLVSDPGGDSSAAS